MYLTYANISHAHIWDYGEGILLYVEGLSYSCSCNSCDRKKTSTTIIPRCPLTYIDGSKSGLDVEVAHPNPRWTSRYFQPWKKYQTFQGLLLQRSVLWISMQVIYFFVVKILRINLSLLNLSPFFVLQISPTFPVAQIYLFTFSFIRRSHNATNNVEETMKPWCFNALWFVFNFPWWYPT